MIVVRKRRLTCLPGANFLRSIVWMLGERELSSETAQPEQAAP